MTTPNDPHDDRFDHPENRPDNQYPSYPSYPSTPHPEDAPGYGEQPYQSVSWSNRRLTDMMSIPVFVRTG